MEVLAPSEAIDEGKMLGSAMSCLVGLSLLLIVLSDSRDLFNLLSSLRKLVGKLIRADGNRIRYEYKMGNATKLYGSQPKLF